MKLSSCRLLHRMAALFMSASLFVCMTGCQTQTVPGGSSSVSSGDSVSGDDAGQGAGDLVSGTRENTRIDDNGKPIYDFDEFVNGEWLKERELTGDGIVCAFFANDRIVQDRVMDILVNTDLSGLSEDDGLYKAVMFYREMCDTSDITERMDAVRAYISEIESVRTLDDLYGLYSREEYSLFNTSFRLKTDPDTGGHICLFFTPDAKAELLSYVESALGENGDESFRNIYLGFMSELGFSEERVMEMISNARKAGELMDHYEDFSGNGYEYYLRPQYFEENEVPVPVFEIIDSLHIVQNNPEILAYRDITGYLNEVFVPENVELFRDHMILLASYDLIDVSGYLDVTEGSGYDSSVDSYSIFPVLAGDVLAEEYLNRYLADGVCEEMESMFEDIKKAAMSVINDTEWLSVHGKEKARAKFMRMQVLIGSNKYTNDLSDVTVTGNAVTDYISFLVSRNRHIRSQLVYEDLERGPYDEDMLVTNAYYFNWCNAFVLCAGLLCDPKCSPDAPYEERLGYAGMVIAHELSHSLDPYGLEYNDEGWIGDQWLSEDEQAEYTACLQRIVDFYDGKDGGFRRTISGSGTLQENCADLLAMQICLTLLSQREDPDYDLFFRTVAERTTMYLTEDNVDYYVDDSHLTGKLRIDYIFGMFDKFYEIYDIDPNSPYYVREQDRLRVFGAQM